MHEVFSTILTFFCKGKKLHEAIAEVWKDTEYFICNPDKAIKLIIAMSYTHQYSVGNDDHIPKELICSPQWNYMQNALQEFCDAFDGFDELEFNGTALLGLMLHFMKTEPSRFQLSNIYTGLERLWGYVKDDELTYMVLEAAAGLEVFKKKHFKYFYDQLFEKPTY